MRDAPFTDSDLTADDFLGGRANVLQPRDGYRAGIDPVLLAASVPARAGQSVLELGCGGGVGLVLLGARVPGLSLTGIELQPGYADLARRNLARNGLDGTVHCGDLTAMPPALRQCSFDHVVLNPPFFQPGTGTQSSAGDKAVARMGRTPLTDWIATAARRLRPFGHAHVILRAERLPDLLAAMASCLGSLEVAPLLPRPGQPPRLILARGRKEGRAPFRLHPGLLLHTPDRHTANGRHYSALIENVTQKGAFLPLDGQVCDQPSRQ